MKVEEIVDLGGGRHKIVLDNGTVFPLYKKELEQLQLAKGGQLSQEELCEIKETILLKRGKKRGIYLLEKQSRSERNLIEKLQEGFYPEDVIVQIIDYAKSFGYLNDENFAGHIVESKKFQKSYREIIAILKSKGIEQETIDEVMEKYYQQDEEKEAIKYLMNKKRINLDSITEKDKNKFFNYLARKGFSYDSILSLLRQE